MKKSIVSRRCGRCKTTKPLAEFYRNRNARGGRHKTCKACQKELYQINREARLESALRSRLRRVFGITLEQKREMEAAQGGVCAICQGLSTKYPQLCVDHDHKTGRIRGLLCADCNVVLGMFHDDIERFETAIRYLKVDA